MRRLLPILCLTIAVLLGGYDHRSAFADTGYVVRTFSGCDYFIADGPSGLYVLEWYGGYDPSEGDTVTGDINSYGMADVSYNNSYSGTVWVEDFLESRDAAMEEVRDHC